MSKYLLIALVGVTMFAHTVAFDFVSFDEGDHILNRQYFLRDPGNIIEVFQHDTYYPTQASPFYRPIQTLSFMADALIAGSRPWWFHTTNVLLHAAVSALVVLLLRRLGVGNTAAIIGALLFAIHPLTSRAVAWVPGRNDVLLAFFTLGSLVCFLESFRAHRWRWLMGHLLLGAAALLTKETAIILPLLAGALWWFRRERVSTRDALKLGIGWATVIGLWGALRSQAILEYLQPSVSSLLKGFFRLSTLEALLVGFGKILFPVRLQVMPVSDTVALVTGVGAVVLVAAALIAGRRHPLRLALVGAVWFIVTLLPASAALTGDHPVLFEHRLYLPLMGAIMIFISFPWRSWIPTPRRPHWLALGFLVATLIGLTVWHTLPFRGGEAFWTTAVRQSPGFAYAHNGLGNYYVQINRHEEAVTEFRRAIELDPDGKRFHHDLGNAYLRARSIDEAQREFERELAVNPAYVPSRHGLAFTYAVKGRLSEAETQWLNALRLDPHYVLAHQGLAILYAVRNRPDDSLRHIRAIQEIGAPLIPELTKILEAFSRSPAPSL